MEGSLTYFTIIKKTLLDVFLFNFKTIKAVTYQSMKQRCVKYLFNYLILKWFVHTLTMNYLFNRFYCIKLKILQDTNKGSH